MSKQLVTSTTLPRSSTNIKSPTQVESLGTLAMVNPRSSAQQQPNMAHATGLTDLPIEMQLRVLSFLPAKQIQRARRINKHFRRIVDNRKNRTMLITPGMNQSLARLQRDVEYFCVTNNDADLLECLSRVVGRLGIPDFRDEEISANLYALTRWVADLYLDRYPEFWTETLGMGKRAVLMSVQGIVMRMIEVHVENHVPQKWVLLPPPHRQHLPPVRGFHPPLFRGEYYDPPPEMTMEEFKHDAMMWLFQLEHYGIDEAVLEKWFHELVETPNGRLQGPVYHYPLNDIPQSPPDEQILTTIFVWSRTGEAPDETTYGPIADLEPEELGGQFPSDYVTAALGIPSIRDVGLCQPFGYCVQPGWSIERIRAVLEGKIQSEIGIPSELAKAALLEDIYLH